MTPNLLFYSLGLFASLLTLGTLLCLKLYKWDSRKFFRSQLWVKTYYWIPIFLIFLTVLYIKLLMAVAVVLIIAGLSIQEFLRLPTKNLAAGLYIAVICLATTHLALFFIAPNDSRVISLLLVVGFSSVLSDVCAYFAGNFFGQHKLPAWINKGKSWEGVGGQIGGAIIGFVLIAPALPYTPPLTLALLIGLASAAGDILNSIVKRQLRIKDWGSTIPGHGGVLDRFASLSLAIAATYWWMVVTA